MQFFRRLVKSKIGGAIALVFLAVMAFAFVAGDITGTGALDMTGLSSAEVAEVGGDSITVNELQTRAQRLFENVRQQQPDLTIEQFLAEGGLRQVLDELIASRALINYGDKHGIRISKKLVDAEIARIPAFADAAGSFSETQFRAMLQQQGISEADLRQDLAGGIIRQHLLAAAAAGTRAPESMVPPYVAMLLEQRTGEALAIPSAAFAPTQPATDDQLRAFFTANPQFFTLPEQRKLRYALISRERFDAQANPTEAEIAEAYKARAKDYAARELRDMSQLILPTEAQAREMAAKAAGGTPLVDLARAAGLSATRLDGLDQTQLAAQTNAETAKAAFAAAKGKLIGPYRAPLGWALLHVENVRTIQGKTLAQARDELLPQLRADKAKQLFSEYVADIDGKLSEGATMDEIVKANGLTVVETPLVTAQGRNLRDQDYVPDETVQALLKSGFAMTEDDDPQIAQVRPDELVAVIAPSEVVPSGPPPFAEARGAIEQRWKIAQGAIKAREAAEKIVAALAKGATPEAAMQQAGAAGQPRQAIAARRADINQQNGRIPPPLEALFTMRAGTARVVPMENSLGFLVVRLEKITPADPNANPAMLQSTRAGLSNVLGGEYAAQMVSAIEKELKVTRNAEAIATVEKALREVNGGSVE